MRKRKRLVLWLLLLPLTSFAGKVSFTSVSIDPNWDYDMSVWDCVRGPNSTSAWNTEIFVWGESLWTLGFNTNSLYCFDSSWYLHNKSSNSLSTYVYDNVFTVPACPECPTCPEPDTQCEEDLAQLSWDYADLSEQYASLLLYNTSIESQLQECLMSWSSAMTWMCNTMDLFWFNNDQMYSVPITNNLTLPNTYRALVDSWVVSIAPIQSIEYANSMDDEEFWKVVEWFWTVFLYFFWISLLLVFMYYIRKYFIWLKN